jgi:hypothetical protein
MKVTSRTIAEPEILEHERLVLDVLQDDDIGRYMVLSTTLAEPTTPTVSTAIKRIYWFPDKSVKKGDVVVLYTKGGKQSEKKNEDNSTSHFFYWGLSEPIWLEKNKAAGVVAHLDEWEVVKPPERVAKTGT